jgi:UDP-glucose 4-epimerase
MGIVYDDAREGDAEHTHADVTKAEAFPDYEPSVSIREGAWLFVDWYREER